jgi:TPP-dependent pyruvate/acetoin dehydrogenase alpha subunit
MRTESTKSRKLTSPATLASTVPSEPVGTNNASTSEHDVLRGLYARMLKCRLMAAGVEGLVGPRSDCDLAPGQEAIVAGATFDLSRQDTIAAPARNLFAQLIMGRPLKDALAARNHHRVKPGAAQTWGFNRATGMALAHKLEKKRNVVVAFGDGSVALDSYDEAFRFAGIHKLPIIYVIPGGPAEQSPTRHSQTFAELSFMVRDYGFPGILVDSADVVAVRRVAQESIRRARNGSGPTLIDCKSGAPASGDPLSYLEHYMRKHDAWDESWKLEITRQITKEIEESVL